LRRSPRSQRRKREDEDLVVEEAIRLSKISFDAALRGDYAYSSHVNSVILRISQVTRVRLPLDIKRSFCKGCGVTLIPGVTARVRVRSEGKRKYIVRRCLVCGYIHRLPLGQTPQRQSQGASSEL